MQETSEATSPALHGRAEAAAAIWDWRDSEPAVASEPETRRLRMRGVVQGLVATGVGSGLYVFASTTAGVIVATIGLTIALVGLLSPTGLYVAIENGFRVLAQWLGRALTWVLLLPLFYLFFLPFGLVLRAGRRDRLQRWTDAEASTYWEPREGVTAASASRQRQY